MRGCSAVRSPWSERPEERLKKVSAKMLQQVTKKDDHSNGSKRR